MRSPIATIAILLLSLLGHSVVVGNEQDDIATSQADKLRLLAEESSLAFETMYAKMYSSVSMSMKGKGKGKGGGNSSKGSKASSKMSKSKKSKGSKKDISKKSKKKGKGSKDGGTPSPTFSAMPSPSKSSVELL